MRPSPPLPGDPLPAGSRGSARSRCQQCGSSETASSADGNESFCASCGLVLSEGALVAGPDGGLFLPASATTVPSSGTARGHPSEQEMKNLRTLAEIRQISSGLNLIQKRDRIKFLWECVVSKRPARTPRRSLAIAACAYVVAMEEELSLTMRQVARLLGTTVWRFAAVYKQVREILKECRITGGFASAAEMLDKCVQGCGTLPDGISPDEQDRHRRLLSARALSVLSIANEAGEVEGYLPGGCAAAAVAVAISTLAPGVSDSDLCYPAGRAMLVSAGTVAKRAAAFRRVLERAALARAGPRARLWEASRRRGLLEAVRLLLDGNVEELRKPPTPLEMRMLDQESNLEPGGAIVNHAGGRPTSGGGASDAEIKRAARSAEEFERKTGGRLQDVKPGKCINPRHVWFGPKDGKYHHHNKLDLEKCYTARRPEPDVT
ncbi:MAG: hypothetical protein BJ554DRAFT_3846 [Olpidium bornovanus]|uniref:Transcription initiation factor IIB n=1 Tax=Olpidium bornovanus TaxID=278681 RepID=A0A8H7ZNU8_9FUNG|nr:MAG: hypothetical protein BJ554DRAFT_3846 [Olpidium bornovanus]